MMFDFSSTLFWYKLIFMAEIIVAETVFVIHLRRRERFVLRVLLSAAGLFLFAFFMPIIGYNAWWTCLMFFIMFFASLCGIKICFKESWWNVLFCGLAAYTIQHIAFVLYDALSDVTGALAGLDLSNNVYLPEQTQSTWLEQALKAIIYALSYFMTYMIAHFMYTDKIHSDDVSHLGRTRFVVLAGIIIITDNIFSAITMYNTNIDPVSFWLERGYNVLTCMLALQLQFSQLTEKEMQTKFNTVQRILKEEQKQYEIVKQNLDTINIKCHDMKHQLRSIRAAGAQIDSQAISEMEQALSVYESVVKTGNETLDLILTEKNLMNSDKDIQITCIADGAQLNFMSPADMYSLFGNALDNAIESVLELGKSKRNVSLFIKRVGNMVSIHVENYYEGERILNNGLPQTSKRDKVYHGYGLLSIKAITEKYGGTLSVEMADNVFNLNILLPKKDSASAEKRAEEKSAPISAV